MGPLKLNHMLCALLLSTVAVGQDVVTVSIGTCLSGLGVLPGPSGVPVSAGIMPNKPESNSSASAPSAPSSTPTGFLINYQAPGNSVLRRRDTLNFPTLDGQATSACFHSPLFNVDPAGRLSVVNAGISMTYSTSSGLTSALFAPSSDIQSISTTWQLVAGTLIWKNDVFLNGTAALCGDSTGAIQAYFLTPIPANCTPIHLREASVDTCPEYFQANPNGQLAPFTSSSSLLSSSGLSFSTNVASAQSTGASGSALSSQSTILSSIPPPIVSSGSSISTSATSSSSTLVSPSVSSTSTSVMSTTGMPLSSTSNAISTPSSVITTSIVSSSSSSQLATTSLSIPSIVGSSSSISNLPTSFINTIASPSNLSPSSSGTATTSSSLLATSSPLSTSSATNTPSPSLLPNPASPFPSLSPSPSPSPSSSLSSEGATTASTTASTTLSTTSLAISVTKVSVPGSPLSTPSSTPSSTPANGGDTIDGTCGAANGNTVCGDWPQGACCSQFGFCGNDTAHCGSGCQSGPCSSLSSSSLTTSLTTSSSPLSVPASIAPVSTAPVSTAPTNGGDTTDGTCGVAHGNTVCGNWPQGSCCSQFGFCGNDTAHCGIGCQSGPCMPLSSSQVVGLTTTSHSTAPTSSAPSNGLDTTDGTCGAAHGNTVCGNWPQGACCSQFGFCGNDTAHCGTGCQSGPCDSSSSSSSAPIITAPVVTARPSSASAPIVTAPVVTARPSSASAPIVTAPIVTAQPSSSSAPIVTAPIVTARPSPTPATTTTTSYTATTTIFTTTNIGTNGQVTVLVVQPTPGMQYFGFDDPSDFGRGSEPDSSRFNNDPMGIDIQGVFPGDINFNTSQFGGYTFPGQSTETNASTFAVAFEGYFFGPPGQYEVSLSKTQTDDYSWLWTNSSAYGGWTNNNAEITESIAGGYTQNHSFFLNEGQFLAMTILWINVFQSGSLDFVIFPPAGGEITDTTGYFAQPYPGDQFVYRT